MVDRLFSEPRLAELYDAFCGGRRDFDFYLPLVIMFLSSLRFQDSFRRLPHIPRIFTVVLVLRGVWSMLSEARMGCVFETLYSREIAATCRGLPLEGHVHC